MKQRAFRTVCLLCAACLFSACTRIGIGDTLLLRTIYLEKTEQGYTVCLLCDKPTLTADAGKAEQTMQIVTGKGATDFEAIQDAQGQSKAVLYGQNELLLLGPNLAKTQLFSALSFFLGDGAGRPNITVYECNLNPEQLEQLPDANALVEQLERLRETDGFRCYLYELQKSEKSVLLPVLKADQKEETIQPRGLAVYHGGERQNALLDPNQTQLARALLGQTTALTLTIPSYDRTAGQGSLRFSIEGFSLQSLAGFPKQESARLNMMVRGQIQQITGEQGRCAPQEGLAQEKEINQWLAKQLGEITAATFEQGNDAFGWANHLKNNNLKQFQQVNRQQKVYQQGTVCWQVSLSVL